MKIDWKRKLTSRKFWAAVASFVANLVLALREGAPTEQTITGMIMAGASLIAYIIGEGLADSKDIIETTVSPEDEMTPAERYLLSLTCKDEVTEDEGN